MSRLPVLISIPHGGTRMPKELAERVCLKKSDLFDDSDPHTLEIYNLSSMSTEVINTEIARAFVDMNRSAHDRPPKNPDGVIKSTTCYGIPIYVSGKEPDEAIIEMLIKNYYEPYHAKIQSALKRSDITLALDCHSMAAIGPYLSPDVGKKRPAICLGNRNGKTCPQKMIEKLADSFCRAFLLKESDITINQPFSGGFITKTYGGNPIPWIQVEMSRALYLESPWFDQETLTVDIKRLQELNRQFEKALYRFFH